MDIKRPFNRDIKAKKVPANAIKNGLFSAPGF